jgi:hypothetical protein
MIIQGKIRKEDLEEPFIKAAVDINGGALSIGCELHIDCAEELIQNGSKGGDIWGINIYPDYSIQFVSLINIRPKDGNRSMEIKNDGLRRTIADIVKKYLP